MSNNQGIIGIVDFNPDTNPDKRQYVRRIGALIPRGTKFEGVYFREDSDLSRYTALILSGSKLSATRYQNMCAEKSLEGTDYLAVDRMKLRLLDFKGNMFGICFGAQLIAHMSGGKLGSLPQTEAGYLDHELTADGRKDRIFGNLPDTFFGAHLHRDFVQSLPEVGVQSAKVLARRNEFIHAYSVLLQNGSLRYGVQPHPEMSNSRDATVLVQLNRHWLTDELGEEEYEKALIIPKNADFQLSETIRKFAEMIN